MWKWASATPKTVKITTGLCPQKFLWDLISNQKPNIIENESPLEIIRKLAVAYYLFGNHIIFTEPKVIELVEQGL